MDYGKKSLELHAKWKGKIDIVCKAPIENKQDLALAYTPGVAAPCLAIQKDIRKSYDLTWRKNTIAVVTDGTAVLGLGDIGPEAGMPVMEGKCALFKRFANVNAIPLCIKSKSVDDIVKTIYLLSGSFGGINLEDIASPRCIEIEDKLKAMCDIPIFHDDQHGTAIIVAAAIINALKVVKKDMNKVTAVINGPGAAGMAIGKLLLKMGIGNLIFCNRTGILNPNDKKINIYQKQLAKITNKKKIKGTLTDALKGADIFIGVSAGNVLKPEMIKGMNKKPIVLAMANPIPEIMPDVALKARVEVMGTGRSDFPNQINNVMVFPGIFRGALDAGAKQITDEMKITAAKAIAKLVKPSQLNKNYILPSALDMTVPKAVAKAVADCWKKSQCKK